MARIITLDTAFSDTTIPTLQWLDDFVTRIKALGPRTWWDMVYPANYTAVSGKLSQVTDLSGNGYHLAQATDANRPPVNTNFWGTVNGVNRGAAIFDGTTDLYLATASSPFDGTGVWTVASYGKQTTTGPGSQMTLSVQNASTFSVGYNAAGKAIAFNAAVTSAATLTGVATARIARMNYPGSGNADYYLETNGVSVTANAVVGSNVPAGNVLVGSNQFGRNFKFNGGLGEIIIFKGDLTATPASMQLVRDYFTFKYRA